MSTNINNEPSAELAISAGDETSNFGDNQGTVNVSAVPAPSPTRGVPETFLAPPPTNRYQTWLRETAEEEKKQREFEEWKADFQARKEGKKGSPPTLDEEIEYSLRCVERNKRISEAKESYERHSQEFKVTSLPKDTLEALELFSLMKPMGFIVTRPKDYRDGLPLAAPGGVVDEEELDTDALYVQQFMMAEKKRAMEEEERKSNKKDTLAPLNNAGGKKKKKKGQGKGQTKTDGNSTSSTESQGEGNEPGANPRIIPIEETLWYSPPHFPRLAKALVQVASQLEKRIGTERAVAALHTALTDEALKAETVYLTLNAETDYYKSILKGSTNEVLRQDTKRKVTNYMDRASILSDEKSCYKVLKGDNFYNVLKDPFKARALFLEADEQGVEAPALHVTLSWYFLEGLGGPADGKKAEFHSRPRHYPECDSVYRRAIILRSRLYSYGLGPIRPDLVSAYELMNEALTISSIVDQHVEWCDFYALARGYRWGLGTDIDIKKAQRYYLTLIGAYKSTPQGVSSIAKPHILQMLREAKEFNEMVKRKGIEGILRDPQERNIRSKHLLVSEQNQAKEAESRIKALKVDQIRIDENGKVILPKGLKAVGHHTFTFCDTDLTTKSAYDMAFEYEEEKKYPEMLKSLAQAERDIKSLTSEERCELYTLALDYYCGRLEEGEWDGEMVIKYSDKLILEKQPLGWYERARIYSESLDPTIKPDIDKAIRCYINAEKLALESSKRDEDLLGHIYHGMGCCYMKDATINGERKVGQPIDQAKGLKCLEKGVEYCNVDAAIRLAQHYYRACVNFRNQSNPGDYEKATQIYMKVYIKVDREGGAHPVYLAELGHLLLTRARDQRGRNRGLYFLETGTRCILDHNDVENKENVIAYTYFLWETYELGAYGIPSDLEKSEEYREHHKRLGGTMEIPARVRLLASAQNALYHIAKTR